MPSNLTRRHFIAGSSAWLAGSHLCHAVSKNNLTISVIHTTDLHGHILPTTSYSGIADLGGFARCATQIRQWKNQNPNSILVDIGDLYQGTAASYETKGRHFLALLESLEYDAWVLGNHDFDWGPEILTENLKAAKIPILAANISGAPKKVVPWIMREVEGFKIALIGLSTPGLSSWLTPETLGGISASSPSLALKKSIAQAKAAKADAIIALGHYGHRKEDDYANPLRKTIESAPETDVFIGGHTHVHIASLNIQETLFTQANYHGIHCGKIDLTFDRNSRKLIAKSAITELMDKRFDPDPAIINLSQPSLKKSSEQLARVLTNLEKPITGKGRNNDLATFICEAISSALTRNKTPVDAVFHGTFDTGDLPAGPVTVAKTWEILPYENTLVIASLTPSQLLEILAEERKTYSDRTLWPFEVIWEKRIPTRILKDGKDLTANKTLTIAFNSYDSQSAGRRLNRLTELIYLPSSNRKTIDINSRDSLIQHFLNLK